MCGRYSLRTPGSVRYRRLDDNIPLPPPRFNIAPSQISPIVVLGDGAPGILAARWGFQPGWALRKSIRPMINARAESAASKPMFRNAFRGHRCLVPADGWYEWHMEGRQKRPYFIHHPEDSVFYFAGLWAPGTDETPPNYLIITRAALPDLDWLHHRQPVVLPEVDFDAWLSGQTPVENAKRLVEDTPNAKFEAYEVSTVVNAPSNDDARCVQRKAR